MAIKKGKKILITEGTDPLGAETLRRFSSQGAALAFYYRDNDAAAIALSRETSALNIRCHTANPVSVMAAAKVAREYFEEELDVLVCHLSLPAAGKTELQTWRETMDAGLNGSYSCIQTLLPCMLPRHRGSIILVLPSRAAAGEDTLARAVLAAGLEGMMQALAPRLSTHGVRINAIAVDQGAGAADGQAEAADYAEVTAAMRYLASDEALRVTGQLLSVAAR